MANNIEWGHSGALPRLLDQDEVRDLTQDEDETAGDYALEIGTDGSMLLYGSLDGLAEWLREGLRLVEAAYPPPAAGTVCDRCGDESNSTPDLLCGRVEHDEDGTPIGEPCTGTYRRV